MTVVQELTVEITVDTRAASRALRRCVWLSRAMVAIVGWRDRIGVGEAEVLGELGRHPRVLDAIAECAGEGHRG